WPRASVPLIVGSATFTGSSETTTAVGSEYAVVEPTPFDAVTAPRRRWPTSSWPGAYDFDVAPAMSAQPVPLPSQRCQTYVNEIGFAPLQPPSLSVSLEPAAEVPLTVGALVLAGALPGAATTAEAPEVAVAEPVESFAVTTARTVRPTSEAV